MMQGRDKICCTAAAYNNKIEVTYAETVMSAVINLGIPLQNSNA
jgi:hypothetical protein